MLQRISNQAVEHGGIALKQGGGHFDIRRGQRVPNGLINQARLLVPGAGTAVQPCHGAGCRAAAQPGTQHIG
jgi:hypothetical protein